MKPKKTQNSRRFKIGLIPLTASICSVSLFAQTDTGDNEDVYELSPFEISTSEDSGYYAENSLAGSRLNSSIRDTPVTLQVYTKELIEDLGAVDLEDILNYSANVEQGAGDEEGFFGGHFAQRGFVSFQARVRGLPSTRARDYFSWQLPLDTYLMERLDESRGPNALLFGIAAAGGIQNQSTKKASVSRDFGGLKIRTDDLGLMRGELDLNQVIVKDKLAVRLNALYADGDGWRSNTYNKKKAIHGGLTYRPDEKTMISVGYESFHQNDIPNNTFVETDYVSQWLFSGSPTFDLFSENRIDEAGANGAISGTNRNILLRSNGVTTMGTAPQVAIVEGGDPSFEGNVVSLYRAMLTQKFLDNDGDGQYTNGYNLPHDGSIVPYDVSFNGPANERDLDATDLTITVRRELAEDLFIQADFNKWSYYWDSMPNGTGVRLGGDANAYFAGYDRTPETAVANPNAGGTFLYTGVHTRWVTDREQETMRLTSTYELDAADFGDGWLSKLGRHRIAAGIESVKYASDQPVLRLCWRDAETGMPAYDISQPGGNNRVASIHYIDFNDKSTWTGLELDTVGDLVVDPLDPSRMIYSEWAQDFQKAWDVEQEVSAAMFSTQSFFFNERLVVVAGYREDSGENRKFLYEANELNTAYQRIGGDDVLETDWSVENYTMGAVFHLTENISVFYNQATNSDIPSAENVIVGSIDSPGQITFPGEGEGKDFGLNASLFDNRINIRMTKYHSQQNNALKGGFNNSIQNSVVVWWDEIGFGLPNEPASDFVFQDRVNRIALSKESEGYEFQLTANITKNWRGTFNYSYTEKDHTNIGIVERQWFNHTMDWITGTVENWDTSTITQEWIDAGIVPTNSMDEFLLANGSTTMAKLMENTNTWMDNALTPGAPFGLRKHKFNFFTNYSFTDGPMKGWSVGGGYRFQGKNAMHWETDENGNRDRVWGESMGYADAMVRYRRKMNLFGFDLDASFQLNVSNLFDDTDPKIASYYQNNSSNPANRYYYVKPRSWRFSASFKF